MDIEDLSNCSHDYVQVLEGSDRNAPEVGTYCGTTVPSAITSQVCVLLQTPTYRILVTGMITQNPSPDMSVVL